MARLHAKKRGRSGSKRPPTKEVPEWVDRSAQELEQVVVKLGKEGMTPAMIGQTLRDQYGVPSIKAVAKKSVVQILKDGGVTIVYPQDLLNLIERAMNVRKHLKANHADVHNRSKLIHIESKIKRLVKYYADCGMLPKGWKYDPETAALLVK